VSIRLLIGFVLFLVSAASQTAGGEIQTLEQIADQVIAKHMAEKKIPGLSLAIVHRGQTLLAKGYGDASIEFAIASGPDTIYPISSVSKVFAGIVAVRLARQDTLDLDASIGEYLPEITDDKRAITVRHLLQHTHGLDDFYQSDEYERESGRSIDESGTEELIGWSLDRPLRFVPGENWSYSLAGYVLLGYILQQVSGDSYAALVEQEVFAPLGLQGYFGGSDTVIGGRNPILYELVDDTVVGHVVDFPRKVWPAGGLNLSVNEFAKLFIALDSGQFLNDSERQQLWRTVTLGGDSDSHYGLGWFSYISSQDRHVVGHEGGGASWVVYYPERRLAVIALSNMSGARADSLPYEIARAAFDAGLVPD